MKLSYGAPASISWPRGADQWADRGGALREPARVDGHDPAVRSVFGSIETIELEEVIPVVGHERALGALRMLE